MKKAAKTISSTWSSWNKLGAKVKPRVCDLSAWWQLVYAIHSATLLAVYLLSLFVTLKMSRAHAHNVSHTWRPIWINHILPTVSCDINVIAVCRPTERGSGKMNEKNRLERLALLLIEFLLKIDPRYGVQKWNWMASYLPTLIIQSWRGNLPF